MIDEFKDAISISLWLKKVWEKRSTIFILLTIVICLGLYVIYNVDFADVKQKFTLPKITVLILLCVVVFAIWLTSRRPAKAEKNKIGIAIAINCETKKERQRLKADFISYLKDEIQRGNHTQFDVFELSEYHSEKLNSIEKAKEYHNKTRAHFILYGKCTTRNYVGKPTYILDLHASVRHLPVSHERSRNLGTEMRAMLPLQAMIPESEEVMGFSVTKEIVSYAARYALGSASLLSLDPYTAFDIHFRLWQDLNALIERDENVFPTYQVIRNKLPSKLVEEGLFLAQLKYLKKPTDYLQDMDKYLNVIQELDPNNYSAHLLRGIYFFLLRDISMAKKEIKKAKNEVDSSWQYSAAFLAAYEGNLESAHKIYQRAFRGTIGPDIPLDVETFIQDVLEAEPDKIQLWYCLGMINYFYKNDNSSARQDFLKFAELAEKTGEFDSSVKFAKRYLEEIERNAADNGPSL